MLICDLHNDLPDKVIDGVGIISNNGHWSEDKLKKENTYVQVFANYVNKYKFDDPFDRVNSMILHFKNCVCGLLSELLCELEHLCLCSFSHVVSSCFKAICGHISFLYYTLPSSIKLCPIDKSLD